MKATKLKKMLLVMGMGVGLSSVVFSANAAPSYQDCVDLAISCASGNSNACDVVDGLCWRYGF
jgi:hypothetical protein